MAFKRLLSIAHRSGRDRSPAGGAAVDLSAVALDDAHLGPPPVLRPAAIFRQLLFDPAESAPVWARPRPSPALDAARSSGPIADRPAAVTSKATDKTRVPSAASPTEPKPAQRPRRPRTGGSPAAAGSPAAPRTRSKRVTKPSSDVTEG